MPTAAYPARKRARVEGRATRLAELGHSSYKAYLSSGEWQAVKARYRASTLPQECGLCSEVENLDMHHMTYERVGEEALTDLVPLCRNCHRMVHVLEDRGEIGLDFSGLADFQRAARYAAEQQVRRESARREQAEAERNDSRLSKRMRIVMDEIRFKMRRLSTEEADELITEIERIVGAVTVENLERRESVRQHPLNPQSRRLE